MDVTLPDGTVVKGVPDGTTKEQLRVKLKANGMPVPGESPKPAATSALAPAGAAGAPDKSNASSNIGIFGDAAQSLTKGATKASQLLPDTAVSIENLGIAGYGTIKGLMGGKDLPDLVDPASVPGTSASLENALRGAGAITPEHDPQTPGGSVADAALQAVPSIAYGGRMMPGQAAKAAGGAALAGGAAAATGEAGGDPATQTTAAMLPALLRQAVVPAKEAVRKRIVGDTDVGANVAADRRAGIANPDPASVTGSKGLAQLQSTFRRLPGGGGTLDEAAAKRTEGVRGRTGEIVSDLGGPVSAERAGGVVTEGAEGAIANFRKNQKKLYDKVAAVVPASTPIKVDRLKAALERFGAPIPGMEELSAQITAPKVAGLRAGLKADLASSPPGATRPALNMQNQGALPYGGAAQLRSRIGEMFEGGSVPEGITQSQAKSIYKALTEDIKASLPPAGKAAWERASSYTRLGHERIDSVYRPLLDKNTPEKALRAAFSGTKEGSSSFRKIMGELTPAQRNAVAAHVVENMGKSAASRQTAEGDAFSGETFLTNWNKMDPGARKALFASPGTRKDLDDIAGALSRSRQAYEGSANPSGTGKANTHAGFYGAGATGVIMPLLMGHPGIAVATAGALGGELVLNHTVSRALTSPEFIKWLAEGTKAPQADQAKYAARLAVIAKNEKDPETRQALEELAEKIGETIGIGKQ